MNHPSHFRTNLQTLKEVSQLSITQFSEALNLPKSTVQSIMDNGHTTLDTACRIANALQIPLSTLTGGELQPERAEVLHSALIVVGWYCELSAEKQKTIRTGFGMILDELEK